MSAPYSLEEVAPVMGGRFSGLENKFFSSLATDTRRIRFANQTLFFAIPAAQRNGVDFIPGALAQGVECFVVQEEPKAEWLVKAGFIQVENSVEALQRLAAWHRSHFQIPVLGITGSNGKTIVKEWICQLLDEEMAIARNPKSYNSQIGVPLSVWELNDHSALGIFEAGISQAGEMEKLTPVIQPTVGLLIMLGDAHDSGFDSRLHKLREKLKLFEDVSAICCYADDEDVWQVLQETGISLVSWGRRPGSILQIQKQELRGTTTQIQAWYKGQHVAFDLPVTDKVDVFNLLHVVNYLLYLGYSPASVQQRLRKLSKLPLRLQWEEGVQDCRILNDTYSNDFTSLSLALQTLQRDGRHNRKTAILSDLSISAAGAPAVYRQLGELLPESGVQRVIGIGPVMQELSRHWPEPLEVHTYPDTDTLLNNWAALTFHQEDILIKGGRRFELEKIARLLQALRHETVLEVNLNAMLNNLRHYKSYLAPGIKMMVMVKAFGYGIGAREVSRLAAFAGIDYLAVAYTDEGIALRQNGMTTPVMVMNCEPDAFEVLEQYQLEPEIYSFEMLEALVAWCRQTGQGWMNVHVKIDTGMHRLGFVQDDWDRLAEALSAQQCLQVKSVFTHFASSEEPAHDSYTRQQMEGFELACSKLQSVLEYDFLRHAANTNAIARHPEVHYDMVRLGIGLYGGVDGLEPVLKLHTRVAQVKSLRAGQSVGYGLHMKLQKDSVIATVRIGYADGYHRSLGNGNGYMIINGKAAPTVGNVCMDMTMLDVTGITGIKPGDLVEIFGPTQSIHQVARQAGTIPYEIMTGISSRVKRVYNEE